MKAHLNKLVPEARVDVGHGQMAEGQLASVMHRFNMGEIDILLSTTIIESGLDIPNANTLIVDRADTFGLAQLYQLRGRVGRGAARAYSYFFRHRKLSPTQEGQQRLEVIAENTQLGAGYSIAMRDLEIRGAGDLLGTRQSGHIQAVGFHLYTRLLADAVRQIRRIEMARDNGEVKDEKRKIEVSLTSLSQPISMPVNVDLPLAVSIPADYIADQDLRLRLYRRIADLRDETEIDALASEFRDRFGQLPEMVQNLFYQMRVKLLAENAGLSGISWESGQIVLRYPVSGEDKNGARLAEPGEFTKRAFLSGRFDLAQAEAVADLITAETDNARQAALNQMRGGFSKEINQLREELIHFASLIELELDFGEEDVEFAKRDDLKKLIISIQTFLQRLIESFDQGNVIKNGVPTVIAGKPNAGKSTLLNTLLNEERAIVSEIPGTTRDVIEDEMVLGGINFRFTDTAGLRETVDVIEADERARRLRLHGQPHDPRRERRMERCERRGVNINGVPAS
jgi:hypothetical protein